MSILIVSNTVDTHADCLIEKMQDQQIDFFRFNTDEYPEHARVNYAVSSLCDAQIGIFCREKRVNADQISAVWFRRPLQFEINAAIPPKARRFAEDECKALLESLYQMFPTARWVSKPYAIRRAQQKLWQLNVARNFGFKIPDTIVTTDPSVFLNFWNMHHGDVLYKPFGKNVAVNEDGSISFSYANKLADSFLTHLESIRMAPCMFQEYIEKRVEFRVTVVGDQVFACEIDSQKSMATKIDWRHYDIANVPHRLVVLPREIENLCRTFTKYLELEFGAIDLIQKPDGEFCFLEINPNGQWLWIEQLTGAPISEALLSLLVQ